MWEGLAALAVPSIQTALGLVSFDGHGAEVSAGTALANQRGVVTLGLCWPARKPVLLLLPACQAIKIKIRDLDSRRFCDCPNFFF